MKYECGLIRDLMPLCADGIAGAESQTAVQAHIAECADCAAQWEQIRNGGEIYPASPVPEETKQYQQAARRVRSKRQKQVLCAAAITTVLTAAVVVFMTLHTCGARFRAEKAALFDVHMNSDVPEPQLHAVGSFPAHREKEMVLVVSDSTDNEYHARTLWCVENVRLAAFGGLWVSNGASVMPLDAARMQEGLSVPAEIYRDYTQIVYAVVCENPAVKSITLSGGDAECTVNESVSENGLCILRLNRYAEDPEPTGSALDAAGRVLFTLDADGRWIPAE